MFKGFGATQACTIPNVYYTTLRCVVDEDGGIINPSPPLRGCRHSNNGGSGAARGYL